MQFLIIIRYIFAFLYLLGYLFFSYLVSKFFGRLAKIIVDYIKIDDWLKAKQLDNALYGLKFNELVPLLVKITVFIWLLQLLTFITIKEIQLVLTLVIIYGLLLVFISIILIAGLLFGEVIKNIILKTNLKIKERLGENLKLAISGLFVVSSLNFLNFILNLTVIEPSYVNYAYLIFVAFLFIPFLIKLAVETYKA